LAQDAIEQHRAVYEAVAHRNAEQAFFAMRRLLRNSTGNVADALWAARHDGEDYH
jgi:DNA-binding FadR family transcriptional regulator